MYDIVVFHTNISLSLVCREKKRKKKLEYLSHANTPEIARHCVGPSKKKGVLDCFSVGIFIKYSNDIQIS